MGPPADSALGQQVLLRVARPRDSARVGSHKNRNLVLVLDSPEAGNDKASDKIK